MLKNMIATNNTVNTAMITIIADRYYEYPISELDQVLRYWGNPATKDVVMYVNHILVTDDLGVVCNDDTGDTWLYATIEAAKAGKKWCEMTHQFHDPSWIAELEGGCFNGIDDVGFWRDAVTAVRRDITGETPVTGEDGEAFVRDNDLATAYRDAGLDVELLTEETWEELPLYKVTEGDPKVTIWDHNTDDGVVFCPLSEVEPRCYSAILDGESVKLTLHLPKIAEEWTSRVWMPDISFGCTDESVWVRVEGTEEYPAVGDNDSEMDEYPIDIHYSTEELVERGWLTIEPKAEEQGDTPDPFWMEEFQSLWSYDYGTRELCFEDTEKNISAFWSVYNQGDGEEMSLTISFGGWYTRDLFPRDQKEAEELVYAIWNNPDDYLIIGHISEGGNLFRISTGEVYDCSRWSKDAEFQKIAEKLRG